MLGNMAKSKTKGLLLFLIIAALFVVISLLVIQKNQSDNRNFVKDRPDDFNFCLNYNTFGLCQIDTYNETFTKDLAADGTKTIKFKLPDDVKDEIYTLMMDIKIMSYPNTLKETATIPPCDYKLIVTIEGKTKTIVWHGAPYTHADDNSPLKQANFLKLVSLIDEYICSTDEYKSMPRAAGGYE